MTNPDDFANRVREMRDAATPGPWNRGNCNAITKIVVISRKGRSTHLAKCYSAPDRGETNKGILPVERDANAAFIAALPDIAQFALQRDEECKRLEARVKELERRIEAADEVRYELLCTRHVSFADKLATALHPASAPNDKENG